MTSLLKGIYRLSGTTYDVIKHCSPDTKTRYNNISYALLLTTGLAVFGGYEIASQFTEIIWIDLLVGLFWGLAVFSFDFFLLNSVAGKFQRYMRVCVGISSVLITVSAFFITLNRATIETTIARETGNRIAIIEKEYLAGKETRYAQLNEKRNAIARYHQANCVTEALNGFPGERYAAKHSLCEETNKEIVTESAKLDMAEQPYLNAYLTTKDDVSSEQSNDYFAKLRLLSQILNSDFTSQFMTVCGFIFFCAVEIQCMTLKFGIAKDDEYHTALHEYLEQHKIITMENINEQNRAAKDKAFAAYKRAYRERQQEKFLVDMDAIQDIASKEKAINKILNICMENGYIDSVKQIKKILMSQDDSSSSKNNYTEDIFEMSQSMKDIVKVIEKCSPRNSLYENIFNWMVENIAYDSEHSKQHYRTALQTYTDKQGLCGELSVLYMSFLRAVNVDCNYCEVTKDMDGKTVTHACVIINHDETTRTLSDVAYKAYKINHLEYKEIYDDELTVKYQNWNQN